MPHLVKAPDNTWHTTTQPYVKTPANVWAAMTKFFTKVNRTAARTITNKALTSNVATLTTSVAHGFTTGDLVRVTGVDATFNGDYIITGTPLTTTFTYAKTAGNVGSTASGGSARSEYWQEIWPLVPTIPTSLNLVQAYNNDRIEWTFSWVAPSGGAAVTNYTFSLYIDDVFIQSNIITHPTVSVLLTNGGAGYQSQAGKTVHFTVVANSAGGSGPTATSADFTAIQLPAPPAPTSFVNTISGGDLSESWSHVSGNRLTDFELQVNRDGGAFTTYIHAKATSVSTAQAPWVGASVNGGAWTAKVRARGPGGNSAWVQIDGTIPNDITFSGYKFLAGLLRGAFTRNANTTSIDFFYQQSGGAITFDTNTGSASGTYNVSVSSGWARDNTTQYRIISQPKNAFGSARAYGYGYCRKAPSPILVQANSNDTWRNSGFRTDDAGIVYQGYTTTGMNYGYAFYGNKFYDNYNPTRMGYDINATAIKVFLTRANDGGYSAPTAPRVWLHKSADAAGVNNGVWYNGTDGGGLGFGDYEFVDLPLGWAAELIKGTNGYKGIGVYHPSTVGSPSASYMKLFDYTGYILFVGTNWEITIEHDG